MTAKRSSYSNRGPLLVPYGGLPFPCHTRGNPIFIYYHSAKRMWLRSLKWIRRCIIEAGNGFTKTTPIAEPDNMPSDKWFGYYSCIRLIQLLRHQHRATGQTHTHTHRLTVGDLSDTSRGTITLLYMLSITGDGHKGYCGNFDRKTSVLCRTTAVDALCRQRRRRSTKQQDVLALSSGDGWSVSVPGKKW